MWTLTEMAAVSHRSDTNADTCCRRVAVIAHRWRPFLLHFRVFSFTVKINKSLPIITFLILILIITKITIINSLPRRIVEHLRLLYNEFLQVSCCHYCPIHSLMLSSHLFFSLPCFPPPVTVLCQIFWPVLMNGQYSHTTAVCTCWLWGDQFLGDH